jgi:hypothetical protein
VFKSRPRNQFPGLKPSFQAGFARSPATSIYEMTSKPGSTSSGARFWFVTAPSRDFLICAGLALGILAAYASLWQCGFITYDDLSYVTGNEMVQTGLNWRSLAWAFATGSKNFTKPAWPDLADSTRPKIFSIHNSLICRGAIFRKGQKGL